MRGYTITIDGRTFDVQILSDPLQEQVQVAVDGKAMTVNVKAAAAAYIPPTALDAPAGAPSPHVPPAPTASRQAAPPAARTVTSPLPGVVKSVAVRPGQQVGVGDQLLVIEAMKMDNVLRAAREGIIDTVLAVEGRQVAHGELLLEYEA